MGTPTPPALSVKLFGSFTVQRGGAPITRFRSDKVRALLAYLASEADRPHTRASLAALLWPDHNDEAALRNLSQTLLRLREALDDTGPSSALLTITRAAIQWRHEAAWVDVVEFAKGARSSSPQDLQQAVELYRGTLLHGFSLPDCEAFEDWLLLNREHYQQQALATLRSLTQRHLDAGRWAEATISAQRQVELDPWRESAYRQLMQALDGAGDRAAALAQYARCRTILQDELGIDPDAETQALYQQILTDDAPEPSTPHHNLPAPLTPFVGREAELAALATLRQHADTRLLSLVGAGGMGKTRLALEIARAALSSYADGVFFVGLASVASTDALASSIARSIGVPLHDDDPTTTLLRWLQPKRLLLVLDNFEHLLSGAGLVIEILQTAPGVQIITTSRERLHIQGEQIYYVEGLAFAAHEHATGAVWPPAARLFVQAARRAYPAFTLDAPTTQTLQRICSLVQGMPLALELAAAWVELLPLEEIEREIAQGAAWLEAEWLDAPERQRSMRAVFEWSWRLLNNDERRTLRQLAVFRGGFTRDAAQHVVGATLPMLARLSHKSLVQWRRSDDAGVRYELHELLRQWAMEQLTADPADHAQVMDRHSVYYLRFVASRARRLGRDEPREAATEIRVEIDNVRQAWHWAVDQAHVSELAEAAYSWWQFCSQTGQTHESRRTFSQAVERLRTVSPGTGTREGASQSTHGLGVLQAIYANHLFSNAPFEAMAAQAREAIQVSQTTGDIAGEALGTFVLGRALQELRRHEEARTLWLRSLELARASAQPSPASELLHEVEWMSCLWLIGVSLFFGDYEGGCAWAEQAKGIAQTLGKRRAYITSVLNLAAVNLYTGQAETARQHIEHVLPLARELQDRWREMAVLHNLGLALHLLGEYAQARTAYTNALLLAREMGGLYDELYIVAGLVRLHCQLGDSTGAALWQAQLDPLTTRPGVTLDCQAEVLRTRAVLALYEGAYTQARTDATNAQILSDQIDTPLDRATTATILGIALQNNENMNGATRAYEQAIALYSSMGNLPLCSAPQAGLAQLALARGDHAAAKTLVDAILPVLHERPRTLVFTPFSVYLICYQVLHATNDPGALQALETAQQRLLDAAASLSDEAQRCAFLQHVPAHREIQRMYAQRTQTIQPA